MTSNSGLLFWATLYVKSNAAFIFILSHISSFWRFKSCIQTLITSMSETLRGCWLWRRGCADRLTVVLRALERRSRQLRRPHWDRSGIWTAACWGAPTDSPVGASSSFARSNCRRCYCNAHTQLGIIYSSLFVRSGSTARSENEIATTKNKRRKTHNDSDTSHELKRALKL